MASYCTQLYKFCDPHSKDIDEFLSKPSIYKTLSPDHKQYLVSPITQDEISDIIKSVKNNKTPDPDGYPIEIYKMFLTQLTPILVKTFNYILSVVSIPDTWKEATIVTIPKPGKDSSLPASFRSIELLNQDYKILTAIMANRLNRIISNYIGPEQMSFISHRTMTDSVHKTSQSKVPESLLLSLDFKKAFDSVEFQYIKKCYIK